MKTFFLGEVLMRLEVPDNLRFIQTEEYISKFTGAEMNSAVMMHCLGSANLHLISCFPENSLGDAAVHAVSHWGISTEYCIRKPGRLGLFFLEQGFGVRPSAVIYDRAGSAFSQSCFEDYDFDKVFSPGDWLYVSGTLPALTPEMPDFLEKVFACAKQKQCMICFDLNYRSALWPWDKACSVFNAMIKYTDILFGNESLAQSVFCCPAEDICRKHSLQYAALTRRQETDARENVCSAVLYDSQGESYESKRYCSKMLDRIGGGDAFSGAMMYCLQNNMPLEKAVNFSAAAQVLKQTVRGDFGLVTKQEIEELLTQKSISVRR